MIDYKYADLYAQDSVDKQISISFDGGTITNEDLHQEEFELTESLCSEEQLTFGCCEASVLKFRVSNIVTALKDKWLTVSETLNGNTDEPFVFGKYKVYSDTPTADRSYRDIVAYDSMYDIINADVANWYNTILPNTSSTVTLKVFRDSFFEHFGITQEDIELVNDSMVVERTVEPDELSGKDVITSICEINGCFGHINNSGNFEYVYLEQYIQGLYPANDLYPDNAPDYLPYQQDTGHLYPQESKVGETGRLSKNTYISCTYDDFLVKEIKKLQIRQEENDIGVIIGDGNNSYIIEDNFLVYGKSTSDLTIIGNNVFDKIFGIVYRPFECEAKGNPCLQLGDPVRLNTKLEIIESYILQRTLKGIQSLKDTYSADGVEEYSEKVNSVQTSIVQLKGKTNTLTRTVEETNSKIDNVEEGLSSKITQNAESITAEVTRATKEEGTLSSRIKQTATGISLAVNNGSTSAGITITTTKEGGTTSTATGTITMSGLVSFTDLSTSGKTTICGDNITTGTINCNLLNGGTIKGQTISGGTISGSTITAGTINIGSGTFKVDSSGNVTANSITASGYATSGELSTTNSNVSAVSSRVSTIEANYISASTVKADYMEVANWTSSGLIKASKIDVSSLIVNNMKVRDSGLLRAITLHSAYVALGNGSKGTIHYLSWDAYDG